MSLRNIKINKVIFVFQLDVALKIVVYNVCNIWLIPKKT